MNHLMIGSVHYWSRGLEISLRTDVFICIYFSSPSYCALLISERHKMIFWSIKLQIGNRKAMLDAGQDNIFIDICLEVVARNIGFGRCLNTAGFSNLEAKFNARINKNYCRLHLKTKWNSLGYNNGTWKRINLNAFGLKGDPTSGSTWWWLVRWVRNSMIYSSSNIFA